jgi:hypothetical protein
MKYSIVVLSFSTTFESTFQCQTAVDDLTRELNDNTHLQVNSK